MTDKPEYRDSEAETLLGRFPTNETLVSFLALQKYEYKMSGMEHVGQHLIAIIVKADEEIAYTVIELGLLAPIAENIGTWRQAVTGRWQPSEIQTVGRDLYGQIWQPLVPYLAGKDTIYVVADGPLYRLAIGALPCPNGQPLGKERDLEFLDVVHDLLTPPVPLTEGSPLICYAPDYGARPGQTTTPTLQTAGLTRSGLRFTPLPGAMSEGEQITALLKKAGFQPRQLTGDTATETVLAQTLSTSTPSLLHIASHGFLLEKLPNQNEKAKAEALLKDELVRTHGMIADLNPYTILKLDPGDPLLSSGIAMAGANLNADSDSGDDGLLTALEAESLNLIGTRLVVLSACENGLGERREGEGVYGLRRAFFLAGARALLTTLWPVDNIVTRRFMERFYQLYLDGSSPRQAVRQVQREFRASEHDSHTVFWAPFHLIEIPEVEK